MKASSDKPIKNFLKDFGLTDKEIVVYMTLLKSGPNTIMNLAMETDIKRSTTHNTVEELIKKGLVSQTNYGERRMVVAEDPDKLKFLMDQKRWDINKLEKNLPDIIKSIYESVPEAKANTQIEVKYYKGAKEVWYIYEQSFKADEYFSFADLEKFYSVYPETQNEWKKSFKSNSRRQAWDILVDSPLAKSMASDVSESRYHVKILPKGESFQSFAFADYIIYDNNVAIIQLDPNNIVATVINSAPIALTLKALHKVMWDLLP